MPVIRTLEFYTDLERNVEVCLQANDSLGNYRIIEGPANGPNAIKAIHPRLQEARAQYDAMQRLYYKKLDAEVERVRTEAYKERTPSWGQF